MIRHRPLLWLGITIPLLTGCGQLASSTSTTVPLAIAKQVKSADIQACLALDQWTNDVNNNQPTPNGLPLRTVAEGLQANVRSIRNAAKKASDANMARDKSALANALLAFDAACKSIGLGPN